MPALKGRRSRASNLPTSLVQARVDPALRDKAHLAAQTLGLSLSAYIELLLEHEELDASGRPLWWTGPVAENQEELPLSRSA